MIIDVHTHPWNSELRKEKPILSRPATKDIQGFEDFSDRLVENMDRLGIDVSVVVSSIDLSSSKSWVTAKPPSPERS